MHNVKSNVFVIVSSNTHKLDLSTLVLKVGAHPPSVPEFCVMEATAVWLGEEKKDRDVDDVCPRIEAYARALNDYLPDADRQRLVTFIPRLPNTKPKTPAQDQARRWLLQETATKIFAVRALEAANLPAEADKLRACSVTDQESSNAWAAEAARAAETAEAVRAARAARAAWAARAARAAWAAETAEAARAAEAAWAAWAARAARAAEAAWAVRAAWAAETAWAAWAVRAARAARAEIWDAAIDLLDRLIKVTEEA